MTHSLALAGSCLFVGMLADPAIDGGEGSGGLLYVFDTATGEIKGTMNPETDNVRGTGWLDMRNGLTARFLRDGSVVVMEEAVFYEHVVVYHIPAQVC